MQRVVEHGRDDARGAVGGGGDHPPARGVFLIHGQRDQVDPFLPVLRVPVLVLLQEPLVPVGRAAADLEPAGQQPGALEADLDAAFHHRVDVQQALPDLRLGAGGALVDQHDLADREALGLAVFQQFGRRAERQREFLLGFVEFLQGRVLLALADNEAAADGEERGLVQGFAPGVGDGERHPVGVPGQDGQRPQDHVLHPVRQGHSPGQLQRAGPGDRRQPALHFLGEDLLGMEALEPEQDGRHGAVAVARGSERAVEVHPQRRHLCQLAEGLKFFGKHGGGPHRTHRVGTGWSYSDGKQVKDSNSHCRFLTRSYCGPADGPAGRHCGRPVGGSLPDARRRAAACGGNPAS
ncbi:hypothetical protein SRABI26_04670 [Arthrobacter sp. Bi26]|nr:hypothetical protein SRABI26_04670 [Arthrobacter sp. Bi26]